MNELVKMLDENLEYVSHEVIGNTIYISVASIRKEVTCPYCGQLSSKVHSHYSRTLQDLPIQGKKVKIVLHNRKFFCDNSECAFRTFAESFVFVARSATKTNRLQEAILHASLTQSSVSAAQYLKENIADVGKSTLCNLLKKKRAISRQE